MLSRVVGQSTLLCCNAECGGGVQEGTVPLARLSASFQSLPHYPEGNWALLVLIAGGWACVHSRTLWASSTNSPVRLGVSSLLPQPPQVFSIRGFDASFLGTGTLGCVVCLNPQLFLLAYLHPNVGPG